jgi:hypothetical protein
MWAFLLVAIGLAWALLKTRETFVVKYGNPFDGEDLVSFDRDAKGTRLVSTTTDACPLDKPVVDAGLCYEECEEAYNGVGPVCWAETHNRGIGKLPKLQDCAASGYGGWTDTGLLCNEPIQCGKGLDFFRKGCWGGNIRPKKLKCTDSEFPDEVTGLCYRKCPDNKPRGVPGMPYLCFSGSRGLSYGRGVGTIPPIFRFGA